MSVSVQPDLLMRTEGKDHVVLNSIGALSSTTSTSTSTSKIVLQSVVHTYSISASSLDKNADSQKENEIEVEKTGAFSDENIEIIGGSRNEMISATTEIIEIVESDNTANILKNEAKTDTKNIMIVVDDDDDDDGGVVEILNNSKAVFHSLSKEDEEAFRLHEEEEERIMSEKRSVEINRSMNNENNKLNNSENNAVKELGGDELKQLLREEEAEEKSAKRVRNAAARDAESMTEEMKIEVIELLQAFGLPFVIAPYEAEAQCAGTYVRVCTYVCGSWVSHMEYLYITLTHMYGFVKRFHGSITGAE